MERLEREIRFAVVMYGGISLAIYMNGIAEELLQMVRATSTRDNPASDKNKHISSTSDIYRQVAELIEAHEGESCAVRFVVDIVSGTSAGGINGVCLAKGLVRGCRNLKTLEEIWLESGDAGKLLNDPKGSTRTYPSQQPRTSLFNSQYMYGKLLDAFNRMESEASGKPLVAALDLFVTATDLQGTQRPIYLKKGVANEHQHKHVFPFLFRDLNQTLLRSPLNQFTGHYDPMLAFASRCTSSFPAAFEPVTLDNIEHQLSSLKPRSHKVNFRKTIEREQDLFFPSMKSAKDGIPLGYRPFADGGYLDNRPFGHAIEAIHARQADCQLERKLLFIDPRPEEADKATTGSTKVSFFKNLQLAAFTLPGYETIREELLALQKRNEWIAHVNIILESVRKENSSRIRKIIYDDYEHFSRKQKCRLDTSVKHALTEGVPSEGEQLSADDCQMQEFWSALLDPKENADIPSSKWFTESGLKEMSDRLGGMYPAYHFTKVTNLTARITLMLGRAAGCDRDAEAMKKLENAVRIWRTDRFTPYLEDAREKNLKTENTFLTWYDIDFRIRRLSYFRLLLQDSLKKRSLAPLLTDIRKQQSSVSEKERNSLTPQKWHALKVLSDKVCSSLKHLYLLNESLLSPRPLHPLAAKVPESWIMMTEKKTQLQGKDIEEIMTRLHEIIMHGPHGGAGTFAVSKAIIKDAFIELGKSYPETAGRLKYLYLHGYDLLDATSYPLLAGGEYGEGTPVDIHRISPTDTQSLWNERIKGKKLAGLALGGFGGFLDKDWRYNDIMWGRLDAAEQLINILLENTLENSTLEPKQRKYIEQRKDDLIEAAQHIIVKESIQKWMRESGHLENSSSERSQRQRQRLQLIANKLDCSRQWKQTFIDNYDIDRDPAPDASLELTGRASSILSSMINGENKGNGIIKKISTYLKALGTILLGMLDFSTPKTLRGLIFNYWIQLIFLSALIITATGHIIEASLNGIKDTGTQIYTIGYVLLAVTTVLWLFLNKVRTQVHRLTQDWKATWLMGIISVAGSVAFIIAVLAYINTAEETWKLFSHEFMILLEMAKNILTLKGGS